jgi:hypothetical protein
VALYDSKTAPDVFNVVWCMFPLRERPGEAGPVARPSLVIDVRLMETDDGIEWADVTAAYGTGAENIKNPIVTDLLIPQTEYRALSLHKPTIFQLDLMHRRRMPWGDKYFVAPEYVRDCNVILGSLSAIQQKRFHHCLDKAGLQFPLPR